MTASALTVPEPLSDDGDEITTALETAAIFNAQGDVREAVRWVRKAAEAAGDAGNDMRALALARAVADLNVGASLAPSSPPASAPVAPVIPPVQTVQASSATGTNPGMPAPQATLLNHPALNGNGSVRPSPVLRVEASVTEAAPPPPPPLPQVAAPVTEPIPAPPETDELTPQPAMSATAAGSPPPAQDAPPAQAAAEAVPPPPPPLPPMPARVPSELAPGPASTGPNTPHVQAPAHVAATAVNLAQTQPFVPPAQLLGSPTATYVPSAPAQPAVPQQVIPQQVAAPAFESPAATPTAAPAFRATLHQSLRARVEVTNELGVLRVTLLAPGEALGPDAYEALLVLTDPNADLLRAVAAE
jgi:hypothetical protein